MQMTTLSRLTALFIGSATYASICLAQTCQIPGVAVGGFYAYSALGTGAPGSLASTTGTGTGTGTTGTGTGTTGTGTTSAFSNTEVGQLLSGIASPGSAFASVGTLYFDGVGNILATSTAQQSGASQTTLVAGSYTLNLNCTITVMLNDVFGTSSQPRGTTLQGIVLNGGSEIDLAVLQSSSTTSSTTGTSTPRGQAPPASRPPGFLSLTCSSSWFGPQAKPVT
jgi:hypothetical protein